MRRELVESKTKNKQEERRHRHRRRMLRTYRDKTDLHRRRLMTGGGGITKKEGSEGGTVPRANRSALQSETTTNTQLRS